MWSDVRGADAGVQPTHLALAAEVEEGWGQQKGEKESNEGGVMCTGRTHMCSPPTWLSLQIRQGMQQAGEQRVTTQKMGDVRGADARVQPAHLALAVVRDQRDGNTQV